MNDANKPAGIATARIFNRVGQLPISEACELMAWRRLHAPLTRQLERAIAASGDRVEPEIVALQHKLSELGSMR